MGVDPAAAPTVVAPAATPAEMVLVYFVYGLAFFSMGFAIALEGRRSNDLKLASSLPYLAAFGILHSLAEWSDMMLLIEASDPSNFDMESLRLARTLLLGLSTVALLQFGADLLSHKRLGDFGDTPNPARRYALDPFRYGIRFLPALLGLTWIAVLVWLMASYPLGSRQWLTHAEIWARFLLYLPGCLIAGFGLLSEAGDLDRSDFHQIALSARLAAVAFLLNAVAAGLVVPPGQYLLTSPINYDSFEATFGFPVQMVRAAFAIAITYFILRVLRVFQLQSTRQVQAATLRQIEAQQEALETHRRAQAEMAQWNQELEERIKYRTTEISLRNRQLLAVNNIAISVSQSLDLNEILDQTLQMSLEALNAEGGGIFLFDEANCKPATQLCQGLPDDFVRTISTMQVNTVVVGQIDQSLPPALDEPGRVTGPPPSTSPRFFLTAPLKAKGRVMGVICAIRNSEPEFGSEDGRLLTAIGHQVGVAIENVRLFSQVQNMAALEERERIAREMHDGLAQVIGFLNLKTRVARQLVAEDKTEQAAVELRQMQKIVQEAYADVRQSILSLRTATELERGLAATIRESAVDFTEQNSIPVELALPEDGEISFPPEAEVQLVRIVQESLANIRKHSGAGKVWIRLERRDGEGVLAVEDDGIGFDLAQASGKKRHCFGLETMRERAESVGARFEVISVPGEGTQIRVRFPLERRTTEARRVTQNPAS